MAITVNELMEYLKDRYQLQLHAGAEGLRHVVTWVHMMEDANVVDFFWGNEMVVTSGYAVGAEGLPGLLRILEKKRCAGVVVNTGPYIRALPREAVDFCNANELPLLTMPWDMSITEFVRASCTRITRSMHQEESLAEAVLAAVRNPADPGGYFAELNSVFSESTGFRMLALNLQYEITEATERSILRQRIGLRIHTALQGCSFPYVLFHNEGRLFLLLGEDRMETADAAAAEILEKLRLRIGDIPMQLGIGDSVAGYEGLADAYHSALSAQRSALLQGRDIVRFAEMGFYRLLYAVPDDALLSGYYSQMLSPLLRYDEKHNSCLTETLFRYLLSDGSLQAVAEAMFSHRNTINYRMGKIRELLGCELVTTAERTPYLVAYHIGIILQLNPAYE